MKIPILIIFVFLLFIQGSLSSESSLATPEIKIIQTKTNTEVSWKTILDEMDKNEILVWGEEHDDDMGHLAQLEFYKKFSDFYPTAISLEMLEKDQQSIVDEYLRGQIPEKQLISSLVLWKNFSSDYLPLLKHARESFHPVLCSNPPRRYVNAIARKGMIAYTDFSEDASHLVPYAYTLGLFQSEVYLAKLRAMFQEEHGAPPKQNITSESMILAQYMWDQGMADSISRESHRSGRKVLHFNGRFHSDEQGGVVYRLRQMGHKVLVLSVFPEGKEDVQNFEKIADFVILTKRR